MVPSVALLVAWTLSRLCYSEPWRLFDIQDVQIQWFDIIRYPMSLTNVPQGIDAEPAGNLGGAPKVLSMFSRFWIILVYIDSYFDHLKIS